MGSRRITLKGLLLARSPIVLLSPVSTLLELLTSSGDKIKIIAAKVDLPADIIPGNYYKLTNLCPRKIDGFNTIVYHLKYPSQIEEEPVPKEDFAVVNDQCTYNFHGKVTAADKVFGIYEVDDSKTLVLSYIKVHCDCPTLEVGDEVVIKLAHRYTDPHGKDYYILCLRSYIHVRSSKPPEERIRENNSIFVQLIEIYGLGIQFLLWFRENQDVVKSCLGENLLKSLGVPNLDLAYADILMMVLCSKDNIKHKCLNFAHTRPVLQEFYAEPHSCVPMQPDLLRLCKPISVKDFLDSRLEADMCINDGADNWYYDISEIKDDQPILAFVAISKRSHRLCLVDGSGVEASIVFIQDTESTVNDCVSIRGKIVLIEKAVFAVEEYVEENNDNPEAEYLATTKHRFAYLMTNTADARVLGPGDDDFPAWTKMRIRDYLKRANCGAEMKRLIPLQDSSASHDSFVSETYVVLHKTPLQISSNAEFYAYLMVRHLPDETGKDAGKSASSYIFFDIRRPHAHFYDLIPSEGQIEVRFPKEKAIYIKGRRSAIPYTYSIRDKLKTTQAIRIPAEVDMYSVNCSNPHTDVYSIFEAVSDPCFTGELVSIAGTIVQRSNEKAKYKRETKMFSNDKNFGLPGMNSVIVLDLKDIVTNAGSSGIGARVYLSWPKSHQYPLGLIPGASIVLNFVYKAVSNSRAYFRSTSLSSVEILKPAESNGSNKEAVYMEMPTGPWVYPYDLVEGASGWCFIDSPCLARLKIEAVCRQCGEPYRYGVCSFAGCSSPLGPKIKASARVILENMDRRDSLFVSDQNVRVLLDVSDKVWNSLLVLADKTGGLDYYKNVTSHVTRKEIGRNISDLSEDIFTRFCDTVISDGRQYHCYCRRFRSSGHRNATNLFCVTLRPPCEKTALKVAEGISPKQN